MKITRTIYGETVEIELTHEELCLAKEEFEEANYKRFVVDMIQNLDEDDDRAALKTLKSQELGEAVDSMAFDVRHLTIDCGYSDDEAWGQVSVDYAARLNATE